MVYSQIQKIIYWLKCKKYFEDNSIIYRYSKKQSGSVLVILPDSDIAFDFAQLFLDRIEQKKNNNISFLLRDSLVNFYSDDLKNFSELFSYQDIDSLGLSTPWFIKKIRKSNYQNMVDLNIEFNPFSSFLVRACNPEVRIGFNYDNSKKYYNVILDQNYQKDLDGTFDMIGKFIKK